MSTYLQFRNRPFRSLVPIPLAIIGIVLIVVSMMMSSTANAEDAQATPQPTIDSVSLPSERSEFFATSGVCATCHTNMKDQHGTDISFDTMWRSTMMANSGRDPYWRAGLRREVLTNPDFSDFIQDKCSTCHMPMARTTVNLSTGSYAQVFGDNGLVQETNPNHTLAVDSISCSLCHQITDTHLGEAEGMSGHYTIDGVPHTGQRVVYGPFLPDQTQTTVMQGVSGFVQVKSEHIQKSELCASCHELYTPYFNVETRELAPILFAEQTPYTEWLNSDYKNTKTCQTCHMPVVDGLASIASVGNPIPAPRAEVSQHTFTGGNVYMARLFQKFGTELGATATAEQFQNTVDRTRQQLQNETAQLSVQSATVADGKLSLDLVVQSLVGHKFPSAYPSRRTWLHVVVRDASGKVIFESGASKPDGMIIGNDNDSDATRYEPHYDVITSPDQVQIYEPVLGDTSGKPTTTLLLASQYLKDNRILPFGYDKATAPADIGVYGDALTDANFIGGSDHVTYQIALGSATGKFTVEAELVYQVIAYRWAENLRELANPETAPEITNFLSYYQEVPNIPELVAKATTEVQ